MAGTFFPVPSGEATTESERVVAWLRLPAIALIAFGRTLVHPDPHGYGFLVVLTLYSAWSAAALAWVYLRSVGDRFALAATAVDIVSISVLAVLSGGAFSHARLAFFLIPVSVAFRFRPPITAVAVVFTILAYVTQAAAHPSSRQPEAVRFIVTQTGFLAWIGVACILLSMLLARRTELVSRLAQERSRLLTDALAAEQRERRVLAEELHDNAIQNLLSARHEVAEAAEERPHPALERADGALATTIGQLRDAVFELHPYVLEEIGLEPAVRSVAEQAASRGHFSLELELTANGTRTHDQLVFSAARELLSNVVKHAEARHVAVRLAETNADVELAVSDDGRGFSLDRLSERLANGHIGLAAQRVRVESAGGRMDIASVPGSGTQVTIRLPSAPAPDARRHA